MSVSEQRMLARKKFLAQAGQGWGIGAAEQVGRNREIELIDQILLEQGAEKCGSAFAGHRPNPVFTAQLLQHPREIDRSRVAQVERRFLPQQSFDSAPASGRWKR